ncbi:MAG TPA: GGDEF domain-containing protein, partial [Treponemataceae bacterium]|nr:GGDEF domain-containing protein [Treponemataceae bacterium]
GIVFFNENNISSVTEKEPKIALVSLSVNNEVIKLPFKQHGNNELRFQSNQKNIEIGYSAIDFSPLAKYVYSYILEGFETEWNIVGDRKFAMYTNLSPGKYIFRVRTVSGEDDLNNFQSVLHIIIEKPLFLRWYFLVVYFLVALGMIFIIHRVREGVLLKRKVYELEKTTTSLRSENTQLEYLSYRDSLTGLANRRYFEYAIHREWEADLIKRENLSVIMIDIDYFKLFNDSFGHQEGDNVLRVVSTAIKTALFRVSDIAARYGGEEFVIILSETNEYNTRVVCDRVMAAVAASAIPFKTEMSDYLTVSIGAFTAIPDPSTSKDTYVRNADNALYQSKRNGRNRISVYTV